MRLIFRNFRSTAHCEYSLITAQTVLHWSLLRELTCDLLSLRTVFQYYNDCVIADLGTWRPLRSRRELMSVAIDDSCCGARAGGRTAVGCSRFFPAPAELTGFNCLIVETNLEIALAAGIEQIGTIKPNTLAQRSTAGSWK